MAELPEVLRRIGNELISVAIWVETEKQERLDMFSQLEAQDKQMKEQDKQIKAQDKKIEDLSKEVEKYRGEIIRNDPIAFRESVVSGLRITRTEDTLFFLVNHGDKWNYKQFADELCDILIMHIVKNDVLDLNAMKKYQKLSKKLLKKFVYLVKPFEENIKKWMLFIEDFEADHRTNFARFFALCIGDGQISPSVLLRLPFDASTADNIALNFLIEICSTLKRMSSSSLVDTLKQGGIHDRLSDFFPANERKPGNIQRVFESKDLAEVANLHKLKQAKLVISQIVFTGIDEDDANDKIIKRIRSILKSSNLQGEDIVDTMWSSLMVLATTARLERYTKLFKEFSNNNNDKCALILSVQKFCYENADYQSAFPHIIDVFCRGGVISAESMKSWKESPNIEYGKDTFIKMVENLPETDC